MKKRVLSVIASLVLLAVVVIPNPAIAEAAPFWTASVSDVITESLLVSLPDSSAPIISTGSYTWDASPMVVGQIKTLVLRVRNMPGGTTTIVSPTVTGVPSSVTAVWSDPSGFSISPTYPTAGGYHDYTLTVTAVSASTGLSFSIGFSRP